MCKAERRKLEQRRKQKEENEKKSQVVQKVFTSKHMCNTNVIKITNTAKLKRMSKKQLKRIEKR